MSTHFLRFIAAWRTAEPPAGDPLAGYARLNTYACAASWQGPYRVNLTRAGGMDAR